MKHRVERSIDGSGDWLVLDTNGDVVYATRIWAWALEDAIVRYTEAMTQAAWARAQDVWADV